MLQKPQQLLILINAHGLLHLMHMLQHSRLKLELMHWVLPLIIGNSTPWNIPQPLVLIQLHMDLSHLKQVLLLDGLKQVLLLAMETLFQDLIWLLINSVLLEPGTEILWHPE
jgi:hypothetical protein